MSYGFLFNTGNGAVTTINSSDRPNWWYVGSFQLTYNSSTTTSRTLPVNSSFTQFMMLQIPNGDGGTYGVAGRPPAPAVPVETLQLQTITPTFSSSGGILTITTPPHVAVVRVNIPATWTCKVFGTY